MSVRGRPRVSAILDEVPQGFRAVVVVAADCSLRRGGAFGVRVQDLDFVRLEIHVRQQIRKKAVVPCLSFRSSVASVPMPEPVGVEIAQHLERTASLTGERLEAPATGGLISYGRERQPLNRNYFNQSV